MVPPNATSSRIPPLAPRTTLEPHPIPQHTNPLGPKPPLAPTVPHSQPPSPDPPSEDTLQLDLPILLPDIEDERDPCSQRLIERGEAKRGVLQAHVVTGGPDEPDEPREPSEPGDPGEPREPREPHASTEPAELCIHYDPGQLTLREITRIVEGAGAEVTDRYAHDSLWIRGMDCADCSMSIEHVIARQDGVLEISVNYAAERARIEYDTERIDRSTIIGVVESMGYEADTATPGHAYVGNATSWSTRTRLTMMPFACTTAGSESSKPVSRRPSSMSTDTLRATPSRLPCKPSSRTPPSWIGPGFGDATSGPSWPASS